MKPGYYPGIEADDYHRGEGVSKSILDLVDIAPALVQWSRDAPRDEDAVAAVDIGSAFHTLILEPDTFDDRYAFAPDVDRRTTRGKQAYADFLAEAERKPVLNAEQVRQLTLMRDSAMAHPYARMLLEEEGDVEPSIYWIDHETGLLCRCRPDKRLKNRRIIVDVKTTGEMERFAASIEDYRYHVQDAFYSEGDACHFGAPLDAFVFLVVSTARDRARYPVRVFVLGDHDKDEGRVEFRRNLTTYAECKRRGVWPGIESISRPAWARRSR